MRVLSENDRRFFDENGYVVVHEAVPTENLQAVIDGAFDFLGMDPKKPDDWYRPPLRTNGMVEMYQHQAMWDNRQYPRLHAAFADLFGHEKLWVSFDRVNLKPPRHPDHPEYDFKGFMHWDADVTHAATAPFAVQGVLYLADTPEDMGGFQCAPGHHKVVKEWAKTMTPGSKAQPNMSDVPVVPIPGRAGDLLIWNRLLYHGNGHNLSDMPRLAQYLTMFPAPDGEEFLKRREDRIYRWRERLPPDAAWAPGDPRRWEQTHGRTADLTPLGRRILGLDMWE
jgi:hypothetical protein